MSESMFTRITDKEMEIVDEMIESGIYLNRSDMTRSVVRKEIDKYKRKKHYNQNKKSGV